MMPPTPYSILEFCFSPSLGFETIHKVEIFVKFRFNENILVLKPNYFQIFMFVSIIWLEFYKQRNFLINYRFASGRFNYGVWNIWDICYAKRVSLEIRNKIEYMKRKFKL